MKKIMKKIMAVLTVLALLVIAVFLAGRYGWKLLGFSACESAGIESVEVSANGTTGPHSGPFPGGSLGSHVDEETGTFEDGLYVLLERSDVYSVNWHFESRSGGITNADHSAMNTGTYLYLDNDIRWAAGNLERPVPFMLAFLDGEGNTIAQANMVYDPENPVLIVTLTSDAKILANGIEVEKMAISAPYKDILAQYQRAISEGWCGQQLVDAGLNHMIRDVAPGTVGYAVDDLDGDGIPEFAVGTLSGDEFYGKLVFTLYTQDENGNAVQLFSSTERDRYYYAGGIRFANLGSSAFDDSFVTTLKLENGELVDMTYTTAPADYVQMELIPFLEG